MMWSLGIADLDSTIEIVMDQKSIHDSETKILGDSCFFPVDFSISLLIDSLGLGILLQADYPDFYDFLLGCAGKSKSSKQSNLGCKILHS